MPHRGSRGACTGTGTCRYNLPRGGMRWKKSVPLPLPDGGVVTFRPDLLVKRLDSCQSFGVGDRAHGSVWARHGEYGSPDLREPGSFSPHRETSLSPRIAGSLIVDLALGLFLFALNPALQGTLDPNSAFLRASEIGRAWARVHPHLLRRSVRRTLISVPNVPARITPLIRSVRLHHQWCQEQENRRYEPCIHVKKYTCCSPSR
jgi:hypothetical protein